jgi:hypothetical protein
MASLPYLRIKKKGVKQMSEKKEMFVETLIEETSKTVLKIARRTLLNLKETCSDLENLIAKVEERIGK